MDAFFEYGTADYDDENEAIEAAWKIKQEIDREIERRERLVLEREKRESKEKQKETVVGRPAVLVSEYVIGEDGELRKVYGDEPEQKSEEHVEENRWNKLWK